MACAAIANGGRDSPRLPDLVWVFRTDDNPGMVWVLLVQSFEVHLIERNDCSPGTGGKTGGARSPPTRD